MIPSIVVGAATDIGKVRSENQDTYGIFPAIGETDPKGRVFVVADGMGGHRGGKNASEIAVRTIGETFFAMTNGSTGEKLVEALETANDTIRHAAFKTPSLAGMGTTCVALALSDATAHVAHIGDSRIYRITDGKIIQLTEDHTLVAEMVRRGLLSEEEAMEHPERSVLYRALGTGPEVEVDLQPEIPLVASDRFVLGCDGLTNMVDDEEIHEIVMKAEPQDACDVLVRLANDRGGYDNVTVIVVQVP